VDATISVSSTTKALRFCGIVRPRIDFESKEPTEENIDFIHARARTIETGVGSPSLQKVLCRSDGERSCGKSPTIRLDSVVLLPCALFETDKIETGKPLIV
jgi:hypothetical protein